MEWAERWLVRVVTEIGRAGRSAAVVVTVAGLGACWGIALRSDPVTSVSRHWFYVPVIFAAARFGMRGALTAGVAAGLLAGPLAGGLTILPVEVSIWGFRAAFFIGVGMVVAALVTVLRRSLAADGDLARREAELANQQATFIQTISHELRTPMTILRGGIETLDHQEARIDASLRPLVASLGRAERRLEEMVSAVLATADAADASRRIETEPVNITRLCDDIIRSIDAHDAARRVRVDSRGDDWIVTVPAFLRLILRALIENGVKFTPRDSEVHVTADIGEDRAVISVRDHGDGMDEQLLGVAFNPFTQGDGSSRRAHGGLGLGLFTARRLAERLGGTLTATPAQPGLIFTITLPQRRQADGQPGLRRTRSHGGTPDVRPTGEA